MMMVVRVRVGHMWVLMLRASWYVVLMTHCPSPRLDRIVLFKWIPSFCIVYASSRKASLELGMPVVL